MREITVNIDKPRCIRRELFLNEALDEDVVGSFNALAERSDIAHT